MGGLCVSGLLEGVLHCTTGRSYSEPILRVRGHSDSGVRVQAPGSYLVGVWREALSLSKLFGPRPRREGSSRSKLFRARGEGSSGSKLFAA